MSARAAKPRNPSGRGTGSRVKVDQDEDKMKVDREETKENFSAWGVRIPSEFDPDPMIALPTSVKKDEPSDGHGELKHEDGKSIHVKPEETKQEHTKRETNSILSPARLWEHDADGQRYIPKPTSVANKLEDVADPPNYAEQDYLPQENEELPPPPSPQRQPPPQAEHPQSERQAWRHYHDERAMPEVEIVLPRWEDVRRQKAAQAMQARGVPPVPGAANARQTPIQDRIVIKPEPEDDEERLMALEEHDPADVKDVLRTAVQNLRNPVAKVKKELLLDDEFLLDALTWEGINYKYPVPLPQHIAEFELKREYISHLYGGNTQETFPEPREEMREQHGLNDWAFLSLDYNPHAPTKPGHSGLFFSSHRAAWNDFKGTILRTFVRVRSGKWVYMGQYKMEVGMSLTTDHWKQQTRTVREAWAEGILTTSWGVKNCIRIWLRKEHGADYRITKKDMTEGYANIDRIRANLTKEDIIGAYDRSEEEMGTHRMTCVGYEAEFVDVLVRNVPRWVIFDKELKAKRRALKAKGKGKAKRAPKEKKKGTGSKRKPIEIDSDSGSNEEEEKEDGEDGDGDGDAKMEVKSDHDDGHQEASGDLVRSSTGRPRRAAALNKRQRTS